MQNETAPKIPQSKIIVSNFHNSGAMFVLKQRIWKQSAWKTRSNFWVRPKNWWRRASLAYHIALRRQTLDRQTPWSSLGSVTDTDTVYRGISKYRYWYRSRYSKYRKIPNTEEKIPKTINRYFNFVNTSYNPLVNGQYRDFAVCTAQML